MKLISKSSKIISLTLITGVLSVNLFSCSSYPEHTRGDFSDDTLPSQNENETSHTIDIDDAPEDELKDAYNYEFISDLSEYEQYMNPSDRDAYLTLINIDNKLDENYVPDDLIDVVNTRTDRSPRKMRLCAEKALEALFIEMYANGYTDVSVTSGYRSYAEQSSLFNTRLASYSNLDYDTAYKYTAEVIAVPGSSEHQSGLCCDMHNLPSADISFENEDAAKWLAENCYKFGFILRYPKDKTEITKISFEPWHFRFVGRYHASRMYEEGLCLEEYCAKYYPNGI